jgi:uncharacterized protein with NAD-binding domain and iron-sulfur cluster
VTRRRIVICGGGIAGLTAAFELTRPGLQETYDVTIYQLGWRVGGKLASGRDSRGRNIEHGLHIWFGFYENAFGLMREVYEKWKPRDGQRITKIGQAIQAKEFTPIGNSDGAAPGWIDIKFLPTGGEPGRGEVDLSLLSCLHNCLKLLVGFYDRTMGASKRLQSIEPRVTIDRRTLQMLHRNRGRFDTEILPEEITVRRYLGVAVDWLAGVDEDRAWYDSEDIGIVTNALREISSVVGNAGYAGKLDGKLLAQTLELGAAFFAGIVEDILLGQRAISEVDGEDFRQWLVRHGATRSVVEQSPIVKALYDTMFQYPDGKIANASYGAGTAAQVVLRMLGTYKGAMAWELQAGAGEVVIAPLFEVLKARGVKFQFFHKLAGVQVSSDGASIESLRFDRQVRLKDPKIEYEPLQMSGDLIGWGSTPNWDLIENGKVLEKNKVDLESHWYNDKVETIQIERIRDFDDVVLAVPLGTFKDFGSGGGPCSELLTSNPEFKSMTEKLPLVPSISAQLWTNVSLADLGWTAPEPALVSGPEPLDIWADMSQLLAGEIPIEGAPAKSLQYLCDVFPSQLYQTPRTQSGAQEQAQQQALSLTVEWLTTKAKAFWPKFTWKVLYAPAALKGQDRLSAQVVRANINPSDCCVATSAGSSAWRLKTDQSGFDNLYLAGAWIDTGFNTECVEAAVMSGMQAARAITGEDKTIPGEAFLHATRAYLGPCDLLRRYVFAEVQDTGG